MSSAPVQVKAVEADAIDSTFRTNYIDLISEPLGGKILAKSDDFFAAATNLLTATPPVRKPGYFVETGAWYDGWETRRHNRAEYDHVVIKLGVAAGRVAGIEIDTAHFNGNHAPAVSIEGVFAPDADAAVTAAGFDSWQPLLPVTECGPSQRHAWQFAQLSEPVTHVRLRMYPDGGIARFRLYGLVQPVFSTDISQTYELSATVNGGVATSWSDQHFGHASNILLPGRGKDMGDGWETKRTRGPHVDWVVVRLGAIGSIDKIVIDTRHFRGNFPREVLVMAALVEPGQPDPSGTDDAAWTEVLMPQATKADIEHVYEGEQLSSVKGQKFSHVKVIIVPDGGIKRLRVFGRRAL